MKFSTRYFSHNEKGKYFTTEASDLPDWQHQEDITLVSDLDNEATFQFSHPDRSNDEDNEIHAWVYYPSSETLQRIPRLQGYHITVFND